MNDMFPNWDCKVTGGPVDKLPPDEPTDPDNLHEPIRFRTTCSPPGDAHRLLRPAGDPV